MTQKSITDIKVVGLQHIKKDCGGKIYEFILHVYWSNHSESVIYRPHSMIYDFQAVLAEMFKNEKIPPVPVVKFGWHFFGKSNTEKESKLLEEFCKKIISLPPVISKASVVLHFFETWGTDKRTNERVSELIEGSATFTRERISLSKVKRSETPVEDGEDQYSVLCNFKSSSDGEISLVEGAVVTVIEKNERGWWFIADANGQQGWAPAAYLEPALSEDKEVGYHWVSVRDANGKGEMYSSIVAYKAENMDELTYGVGELIEVLDKSNYGWWRARIGNLVGITPAINLQKAEDAFIYESADEYTRKLSISSQSGLYAVVRKIPPRKESIRSSSLSGGSFGSFTSNRASSKLINSVSSFSGGQFIFEEEKENHQSSNCEKRRASADNAFINSEYINVDVSLNKQFSPSNSKSYGDLTRVAEREDSIRIPPPKPPRESFQNIRAEMSSSSENISCSRIHSVQSICGVPMVTSEPSTPEVFSREECVSYEENLYDEPEMKLKSDNQNSWYYGEMSRGEAENLLSTHGKQREFLVRQSKRAPDSYAISVKYCCRIRHFPIKQMESNEMIIGKLKFCSLADIIKYYKENALFISERNEPICLGDELVKERVLLT